MSGKEIKMLEFSHPSMKRHVRKLLEGRPIYCKTGPAAAKLAARIRNRFHLRPEIRREGGSIKLVSPAAEKVETARRIFENSREGN